MRIWGSGRVGGSWGGGRLLLDGLCGLFWSAPGGLWVRILEEMKGSNPWGTGAYAFESGFRGHAGFGIVLAADRRCRDAG